ENLDEPRRDDDGIERLTRSEMHAARVVEKDFRAVRSPELKSCGAEPCQCLRDGVEIRGNSHGIGKGETEVDERISLITPGLSAVFDLRVDEQEVDVVSGGQWTVNVPRSPSREEYRHVCDDGVRDID